MMSNEEEKRCPLCAEEKDWTDQQFKPCKCGYQVAELKKKQNAQAQLLIPKQKSDEAAKRLHDEILRIKTQKVQLHQKIKQESEQFRMWKASREKEVLQVAE